MIGRLDTYGEECFAEGRERAFSIVAPTDLDVTFSTQSRADTVLALLTPVCSLAAADTAVCNDDDESGSDRSSRLQATLTGGVEYILIYDHFVGAAENGTLLVEVAARE